MTGRRDGDDVGLLVIPFSHFCRKAEWGLTQARVPYTRLDVGLRQMPEAMRISPEGTLPVLYAPEPVAGSGAILEWADRRRALEAPPLYPGAQAKAIRAWESWADEVVAPVVRREAYRQLHEDPRPFAGSGLPVPRLAKPMVLRVLKFYRARRYEETDPDDVRAFVPSIAGRLRATGTGYLFGDQPTAADLATAAFLEPLVPLGEARGYARTPGWSHAVRFVERVRPATTSCVAVHRLRGRELRALAAGPPDTLEPDHGPMVGHRVRG